jgi:lipopolysaccharide/colanic/teichoic acid biosynthesis glycosyltransferase
MDFLLPAPHFLQRIREERSRSDRSGRPFSLVLIPVTAVGRRAEEAQRFYQAIEAFARTVRLSDIWGWYQEERLGLILTDTAEAQAWQVVERLARALGRPFPKEGSDRGQGGLFSVIEYPKVLEESVRPQDRPDGDRSGREVQGPDGSEAGDEGVVLLRQTSLSADSRGRRTRSRIDSIGRRSLDLVLASVALVLASPVMAAISLIIKLTSRGPVLFAQKRLGKGGREFTFLKFRTMHHNCDQGVHKDYVTRLIQNQADSFEMNGESYYKLLEDPRVTRFGRFLRRTSLDELPQLLNVLRGEMSLVGPRPPIGYEVERYKPWQLRRVLEAKPGITGLWQVSGRSTTTFDEQVRLDLKYVEERSFFLNVTIILKTFKAVLSARGAY